MADELDSGVCNAPLLLTLLDRTLAKKLLDVFSRSLLPFSAAPSSSASRLWSSNVGNDLRAEAERLAIFPSMCLNVDESWCIELLDSATRLRTGGGDNALTLDKLPNLDLGDSESPVEELEGDDGATELFCHTEVGRVPSRVRYSSYIFAGRSFVKLGMSGDPGGDESGLGIGGYCALFALAEACSVCAGDPCPRVACNLPCSSGAFPNVWRLGGAGNGCAAYTTIS